MLHVTRAQASTLFVQWSVSTNLFCKKIFCLVIGVMQQRVVYCQDLLLMGQDNRFWKNIINRDETWCFAYDPVTKRQSALYVV
jgi:hypothetical protein